MALLQTQGITSEVVGLGIILFDGIALIPLVYLGWNRQLRNRYTLWIVPLITLWIADVFIYNNALTQYYLPTIILVMIGIVYLTSMHKVDHLYQTMIPRLLIALSPVRYLKVFFAHLFTQNPNYAIYKRVLMGVVLTLPFFALFLALFMSADTHFNTRMTQLIRLFVMPQWDQIIIFPFYFLLYLSLFLYSYLNRASRLIVEGNKSLDPVIVGIFLGGLNLLFVTFLVFQIAYLFGGEGYIAQSGIAPAVFACEGFFQLAWVIGLVVVIFLGIIRHYQGEMSIKIMMTLFMIQTIIMGIASLKKMYLYQTLMGVTTLCYYVEWFEYFLIAVLVVGIVLMIIRQSYHLILSTITAMGLMAFSVVASLDIDYMIASHNVEAFTSDLNKLDTTMLSTLSIDALPAVIKLPIILQVIFPHESCQSLMEYHFGRCQLLDRYGETQLHYPDHHKIVVIDY